MKLWGFFFQCVGCVVLLRVPPPLLLLPLLSRFETNEKRSDKSCACSTVKGIKDRMVDIKHNCKRFTSRHVSSWRRERLAHFSLVSSSPQFSRRLIPGNNHVPSRLPVRGESGCVHVLIVMIWQWTHPYSQCVLINSVWKLEGMETSEILLKQKPHEVVFQTSWCKNVVFMLWKSSFSLVVTTTHLLSATVKALMAAVTAVTRRPL